ncbi:hypothetical protein SASPL_156642 [Salvia splendens]|uniref:Thaumatin-like protein 1 n=1 Tax=Salvia splendens TaxID=180675 RepID=A0A8X8YXM8_SALSN|nr:hypothetical protein SASPL_156642 [Salvia splendens]
MHLHSLAGDSLRRRTQPLSTTGFALSSGDSFPLSVPASWSGRIWGRTLCSQDPATGKFACATADCGSGTVECSGAGAVPPATLAEFTLNGVGASTSTTSAWWTGTTCQCSWSPGRRELLEHGVRGRPQRVVPVRAEGGWRRRRRGMRGCRSACEAFGDPKYCCSGGYATPETCGPTQYSQVFKNACPRAYSYAYDDKTSTFTCASAIILPLSAQLLPASALVCRTLSLVKDLVEQIQMRMLILQKIKKKVEYLILNQLRM